MEQELSEQAAEERKLVETRYTKLLNDLEKTLHAKEDYQGVLAARREKIRFSEQIRKLLVVSYFF